MVNPALSLADQVIAEKRRVTLIQYISIIFCYIYHWVNTSLGGTLVS